MLTRRSARINKNADDFVVVNDYFNEYERVNISRTKLLRNGTKRKAS